ncbi:hypothetical protein RHS01_02262 [Rhizoctonia solani]|uniref:Zn(2)-C6 fungal-type domain-containing protein n=1 Tax=Rhizoctonia solani TaxID=456999 RepID=A0A8H7M8S6_9AGAM|nr:hypothetical protein RHS01_02262 [Rhizoctonia solani]
MAGRSTLGCSMCKAKRKKCDEAKPECRRCTTSGVTCVYEYVEVPREQSYKVRRTKPAPRTIPERLATAPRDVFRNVLFSPDSLEPSSSRPPDSSPVSGSSAVVSRSSLREPWAEQPDLAHSIHPLDRTSSQTFPLALSRIPYQIDQIDVRSPSVNHRGQDLRIPGTYNVIPFNPVVVPTGSLRTVDHDEVDEADEDPEGIQALMYTAPTLDKNVTDNSLPFVLHCYSQWTVASIFEPLEIVHGIREHAIQRFSSQDTRYKTILMANVMKGFAQDPLIDNKRMSILSYLAVEDRQNAMYILDYALEDIATNYLEIKVLTLQTRTQSTFAVMKSMNCIAPIFRRACPDLPGRPINLPNIILGDRIGLRYFACADILASVLIGIPTCFQYEVPFSLDLCNRVKSYQSFQSIQGVPDQLIMFFAWVNSLCETPGAGDNPEVVAWAEEILPQIKFVGGETGDPVLRICRMAIQECWRLAAYIYLYMAAVATTNENERKMISRRFFAVREGSKPGTLYHDLAWSMIHSGPVCIYDVLQNYQHRINLLLDFSLDAVAYTEPRYVAEIYARMQYMQDEHKMATDVRSATRPSHNAGDAQVLEKSAATTPRPSDHLDPLPSASGSFSESSVTGLYLRTNFIRPGESTVSMSSRASLIPSRALYSADLRQQQGTDGETLRNHIPAPIKLIQTIDNTGRDGEYDPEGIQALLCTTPTMDKNVPDNSLPFVLQCYSQWAIVMIFEPLEIVHGIRERVIQRFSSEDTRIKAILMANIMRGFARNLVVDKKGASILRHLAVNLQKRGLYYTTKLNRPILDVDREGALCDRLLRVILATYGKNSVDGIGHDARSEFCAGPVLTLQLHSQPTTIFIQSLDYVAAIFRCACPDLPGKPINLAALMLGSNTSLRWFACLDVLHSILSAKPTHFQYDVPFSIELCNQVQASASFQAVQGVPDQLIMFFAWVNSLCETPAGDSPEVIAWAEEILPQIRFAGGETGDALLRIGRMAIQECWRCVQPDHCGIDGDDAF